jgi:LysR family glycine cleavage system transcriptional activator
MMDTTDPDRGGARPRRLPSLNALRAFEAVVRLGTVAEAARQLAVTPAAVSHQIRALEADLGVTLLEKQGRHLSPTPAAAAGMARLSEGFAALADGVERIRRSTAAPVLTLTVPPTFAITWLVPRLERFQESHPEIQVRIDADPRIVDLSYGKADAAVRYGPKPAGDLRADALFDDVMVPVCSPRLARGSPPLREPADLARHRLIHVDASDWPIAYPDWAMWLRAAGLTGIDTRSGPRFAQEALAIQAAVSGQGVALLGRYVVAREIAAGRLVQPLTLALPTRFSLWFVSTWEKAEDPAVAAMRAWIIEESTADETVDRAGSPPDAAPVA